MRSGSAALVGAGAILALVVVGCQTAPLKVPAESAVRVEESGFAPQGNAEHTSIAMDLFFGNPESIKSWTLAVVGEGVTRMSWSSQGSSLPASIVWAGTDTAGAPAPEGTYRARLSVQYEKDFLPFDAESRSFVLARTPPTVKIALDPARFTPSEKGVTAPLTMRIEASSPLATISSWELDVYDPSGGLVKSFAGEWPDSTAAWDGAMLGGGFVSPATDYRAVASVIDEFGLSAEVTADVPVSDIPTADQASAIRAQAPGFSPVSATMAKSIAFGLTVGNASSLKSWKVSVGSGASGVQGSWSGDAAGLPSALTWDGRTASGTLAPEGSYTATLSLDYGNNYQPVLVRSEPFVLDITPPSGSVSPSPAKLAADGKGGIEPVTFTLFGTPVTAPLSGWSLAVLDAAGKTVASFQGDWPPTAPVWDGSLSTGGKANPTQSYRFEAKFRDVFGNVGEDAGSLATGTLPQVKGAFAVTPAQAGFSPNGDRVADAMSLALAYGQSSAVVSWRLSVGSSATGIVRSFSGDRASLLAAVSWDGKTDQGSLAPDGRYEATLSVSFGTVFAPASTVSRPFVLVTAAPTGSITLSSALFSPIEGPGTITLAVAARSANAAIDSWSMDIYDPGGNVFRSFSAKWPAASATWDGTGTDGSFVQSAEDYPVVVRIRDQFGNIGTLRTVVPVDILVERTVTGYRILSSRIFFKAFAADYVDVEPELASQNAARLDALAERLSKFPGYSIRIVGHAVMIHWDSPTLGKTEQDQVLIPLSKARADAIMNALVERGLDPSRFTTEGVGAADQLVPDSDYKNRWQNRRVALFLDKQ